MTIQIHIMGLDDSDNQIDVFFDESEIEEAISYLQNMIYDI